MDAATSEGMITFQTALAAYLAALTSTRSSLGLPAALVVITGVRYLRVAAVDGSTRSAVVFIDRTTGDVFKAASWKGPAKGVRCNILALAAVPS